MGPCCIHWFCAFRMAKIKKQGGCGRVLAMGCIFSSSYDLRACGLIFGSRHHKAGAAKRASPTHIDWKLTSDSLSSRLEEGCLITYSEFDINRKLTSVT